jgi:hypothetical protein
MELLLTWLPRATCVRGLRHELLQRRNLVEASGWKRLLRHVIEGYGGGLHKDAEAEWKIKAAKQAEATGEP